MGYKSFLIAPFSTGLDNDQEPWLLPQDAFQNIINGHIHHGYVEKRQGYRPLGQMVHGEPITAATAASPAVFTVASTAGLYDGQEVSLTYLAGGTWDSLNGAKYTVTVASGTTFTLTDSSGTAVDGTGLGTYTASSGRLGRFVLVDSSATVTAATAANPAVFTASVTVVEGDLVTFTAMAGGTWSTLNDQPFTVTNVSGSTFQLIDANGIVVDGSGLGTYTGSSGTVYLLKPLRIMGIIRYIGSDNTREFLISDTERVAIYNATSNLFFPLDLYDISSTLRTNNDVWSSSETDYIQAANWQAAGLVNRVYFTNGKAYQTGTPGTDGIVYYDAANPRVTQFQPSCVSSGTLDLYGCKLIFSIRGRLVCLHTFEYNGSSTSTFPQRARWCANQAPSNWVQDTPGGGGFVDAPTGEQIISAQQLQDQIIVFFTDSVWALKPVPNPALPFRWEKINSFRACDAKMGSVAYDRYSIAVGQRGITATDSVETTRVDNRIEDFVTDEINDTEFDKIFGARNYAFRRTWLLYPPDEANDATAALIYDDESGAFSKYQFTREVATSIVDMNVLGYGYVNQDLAAQDFTVANNLDYSAEDFDDETALSFYWSENAELFLGGDRNGFIHILDTETSDNGAPIELELDSAGWNPFQEAGQQAQFGYIDFYCDSDQKTLVTVQFFKNDNEDPYQEHSFDLLPNLNYRSSINQITPNDDPTTGFVITSPGHGLSTGDQFYIYGVEEASFYNDVQWEADSVTANTITVASDITGSGTAITAITQANPGQVTAAGHGLSDGDIVYICDVTGMTEVNGNVFTVTVVDDNNFTIGVDTSAYTAYSADGYVFPAYVSGGQIVERKFFRTKVWKRLYAGGIGYVHNIKIISSGTQDPLKIHAFRPWMRPAGRILG